MRSPLPGKLIRRVLVHSRTLITTRTYRVRKAVVIIVEIVRRSSGGLKVEID